MKKIFVFSGLLTVFSLSAQVNSLLWKITSANQEAPSYLYGTMHTSDKRVIDKAQSALPYLKSTKVFAMEVDPEEAIGMDMMGGLMMGGDYSLQKMIPKETYALLDSVVGQMGIPLSLLDNVAPVFVATLLELNASGLTPSMTGAQEPLDLYLRTEARKNKQKVSGIETVKEQLSALNVLSYQEQADMLTETLRAYRADSAAGADVVDFYLRGELDSISAMSTDAQMPEKLYKALVTDRNVRMAGRIDSIVQKEPLFVAVGALHLPGPEGLIALLREKGYGVEPVK